MPSLWRSLLSGMPGFLHREGLQGHTKGLMIVGQVMVEFLNALRALASYQQNENAERQMPHRRSAVE